jgi:hypothetical protein
MEKKTETQINLQLSPDDRDLAVVKCRRSRGYPFEDFAFRIESDGLALYTRLYTTIYK